MKRLSMLALLLFTRVALAESPAPEKAAGELVRHQLVEKLAAKERDQSRFSRARLPAQERRVRILDEKSGVDAGGKAFFAFAVDARHGIRGDDEGWRLATITGCAYVEGGEVFVKIGEGHRPAAFLLGKKLAPVADPICKPATAGVAKAG
jgi:hypothetical protein